jgi:Mannosyltransferase putative
MTSEQQVLLEAAVADPPPYPAGGFAGRGIVICAGGERLFTCAWVAIGILRRHLGCRLPIQLWHLGPAEIGPPMRALLEEFDVETVDALAPAGRAPMRIVGGWELKPYAIVHSRFREVFLLDADNVPLIDPATLFDLPQYASTGAIFWPDIVRLRADNPIWAVCGVAFRSTPSFESGQLLVDKQRCWAALQLALHMNQHSDFFYQHLYGDKDTFLMAWLRLGRDYAMPGHLPVKRHDVLNQHHFDGRVIFQHRNAAKWSYGRGNPRIPGFELEEECLGLLAELTVVWNGRVFNPPAMSAPARDLAAALESIQWFTYLKVGSVEKDIQLLADNRIGVGRGEYEFYWWVEEDSEGLLLGLEGRRRTGVRLRAMPDGSWRGRSLEPEAWDSHLIARSGTRVPTGELPIGSATALLAAVLNSPEGYPGNEKSAAALTATLTVLSKAIPGFAQAMGERLALGSGGADDAISKCLSAALARPDPAVSKPWSSELSQGSPSRVFNLGSRYEKNR